MTMTTAIPDPDAVIESMAGIIPVTYGALEFGTAKAHAFFEAERREIEPFLFADITRYHARNHLIEQGRLRVEFFYEEKMNNGLEIAYNGSRWRLRKAFRGGVPLPGSFAMEGFHAQTLGLIDESPTEGLNCFVLWDVIRPSYILAPDLYVAAPKRNFKRFPNAAECHWLVKLPNVALMPRPAIRVEDVDQYDDLDIYRPFEETGEAE